MSKRRKRGNGQGTAIRRGNGWEARVVVGWKINRTGDKLFPIVRSKGGFPSKREALAFCPELKAMDEKPKTAPTLEFYWKSYQKDLVKISKDKQDAYKIAWNKMEAIHHRKIDSLTVTELRDLVAAKAKTYYPAKDMKTVLKHLFYLGAADQWVNKELPEFIVLPELEETEQVPFTKDEQKLLWKSYEEGNKDAAVPLIMIYTGMMTGEMKKLDTRMINLEERKITDNGMKTKVRRKADIILATSIIPVIEDLMAGKEGKLFPFGDTKFYNLYYGALEKAGVRKLTPYSCRHTTATALAIDKNIAPQTIQKIMRWSSTKMLDRYAHPMNNDARDAIETIGKD